MKHTENHLEDSRQPSKLKNNRKAAVGEIGEFLGDLRGKSPQEMLGRVANSNLIRSTILATVMICAVLLVFTAGPYVWAKMTEPDEATRIKLLKSERENLQKRLKKLNILIADKSPESETEAVATDDTNQQTPANTTDAQTAKTPGQTPTTKNPAEIMGEGGVKTADPKKVPLDPLDNLLDD